MGDYTFTGEQPSSRLTLTGGGQNLVANTLPQEARCEAYDAYGGASESGSVRYRPHARPSKLEEQKKVLPSERYALSRHLVQARELCAKMSDAARQNDHMELASQGIALLDELESLWKIRDVREEPWAAVLNFLQSALTRKEFELYSHSQCEGVGKIVEDHLAGGVVSEDDVPRVVKLLKELELDPWRAISEQKESGNACGNSSLR
jgi:hypothetical protein